MILGRRCVKCLAKIKGLCKECGGEEVKSAICEKNVRIGEDQRKRRTTGGKEEAAAKMQTRQSLMIDMGIVRK
jgi:hypothetical protein